MGYRIEFRPASRKSLEHLPKSDAKKISSVINDLSDNPRPRGCVKLTGHDLWRVRVGDYRIIYQIEDDRLIVLIIHIAHRRDVYRGF